MRFLSMQPILPAKDFALSLDFYSDIGFNVLRHSPTIAELHIENFSFILQDRFQEQWAEHMIMHVIVGNLVTWWRHIQALNLNQRYPVRPSSDPVLEAWGQVVLYLRDPSDICWQFAEAGRCIKALGSPKASDEDRGCVTNLRLPDAPALKDGSHGERRPDRVSGSQMKGIYFSWSRRFSR